MAVLDFAARRVAFRFAIAGIPGAGKATLLSRIHASLPALRRDAIFVRPAGVDQIAGFQFTPPNLVPLAGHLASATLTTVPGRVADPAVWMRVFSELDALLFVADSGAGKLAENIEAVLDIASRRYLADVAVVFYISKTDLPGAMDVAELMRVINLIGAPYTTDPAAALSALVSAAYAAA